jgi:hypothetical protein
MTRLYEYLPNRRYFTLGRIFTIAEVVLFVYFYPKFRLSINFDKNWLHFGLFCHKLIWSPRQYCRYRASGSEDWVQILPWNIGRMLITALKLAWSVSPLNKLSNLIYIKIDISRILDRGLESPSLAVLYVGFFNFSSAKHCFSGLT